MPLTTAILKQDLERMLSESLRWNDYEYACSPEGLREGETDEVLEGLMSEYDLTLHLVLPAAQSRMESGDVITYQDKQYRVDETMISGDQVEYILFLKSIHG